MAGARAPEPLPSELNTSSLAFLEVGKDKLSVRYSGPAQHDNDVGAIQANHPVPRRRLVYYFEVAVKEASGGSISLGFSGRAFKQGRHPGYEPNSWGYRGDTGRKHHAALPPRGEEFGPAFGPGDVVGAGIHLLKHEIFFTKNGQHLGTAFRGVAGHPLYPTIGLHSQGARVEVNFGRQPFQYDPSALEEAERAAQAEALQGASVSAGEVHQLVRGYLLHYGYAASLAAFDAAAGMAGDDAGPAAASGAGAGEAPAPAQQQQQREQQQQQQQQQQASSSSAAAAATATLPLRAQLRELLMRGDTAGAQALLQQAAPELLAGSGGGAAGGSGSPGGGGGGGDGGGPGSSFELRFHLACQQYIELIRRNDVAGALAYAEGGLAGLRGASAEHDAALRDVVALIAYQHPEQSPLAGLLAPARREATADVVNAALLRARAPPGAPEPQAALEACLRQLVAVQNELHDLAGGHGPEFELGQHLPPPADEAAAAAQQRAPRRRRAGSGGGNGGGGGQAAAPQEPEPMAE